MSRVKRSVFSKIKHRNIFEKTKGFKGRRKNVLRIAKQALIKSLSYHYRDTRNKKRKFKNTWIKKINFYLIEQKIKYNRFISLMKKNNIIFNRKILFEIIKLEEEKNNSFIFNKLLKILYLK